MKGLEVLTLQDLLVCSIRQSHGLRGSTTEMSKAATDTRADEIETKKSCETQPPPVIGKAGAISCFVCISPMWPEPKASRNVPWRSKATIATAIITTHRAPGVGARLCHPDPFSPPEELQSYVCRFCLLFV